MPLKDELGLNSNIKPAEHDTLLNIYYTTSALKNSFNTFFTQYKTTEVQYHLLLLLDSQSDKKTGGLTQAQLSKMMMVNRANITSLLDRMERDKLVKRSADKNDRRSKIVQLTAKSKKIITNAQAAYTAELKNSLKPLKKAEQKTLTELLTKIRVNALSAE